MEAQPPKHEPLGLSPWRSRKGESKMFRTAYGEKKRVAQKSVGKSMTKTDMQDECNINVIIKKHDSTGLLTHVRNMEPQYGEVSGDDFRESMEKVLAAERAFGELPSGLRKEFNNDPAQFLDFVHDEANQERMVELGLADYKPEEKEKRAAKAKEKKEKEPVKEQPKTELEKD